MTATAAPRAGAGERTLADRLAAAYPLSVAYLVLLVLYGWQTTRHASPWLFVDELKWAELSRSIAHTGHAELRSSPAPYDSLYSYFLAPAWWFGATGPSYAAAKYLNAAIMTAALFPGYAFARLFVPRWPAAAVGVLTATAPALSYSLMLIPEPLAYFWSALVLWLVARALIRPTRRAWATAVAAVLIAPFIRGQLGMLVPASVIALVLFGLTSERSRAFLARWSWRDRLGAIVLVVGAIVIAGAWGNQHVFQWEIAWSSGIRGRIFTYGLWAAGAFMIGVGVLPVIGSLAWLLDVRRHKTPQARALFGISVGTLVTIGLYTAIKAAYLSVYFADRVEERNLIYLLPIVFTTAAVWLLSARIRVVPLALAAAAAGYLVATTPYHMYEHFYSDAPGLSILQWLNQKWYFTEIDGTNLLYGILAGSVVFMLLIALGRRRGLGRRAGIGAGIALAALAVAWNLAGEIAAANSSNTTAAAARGSLPTPPDWIDRDTGRAPTILIGQSLGGTNANALWLTEFWNQSVRWVWSTDASVPPPGPATTPNYLRPDGTVDPQLPADWVVAGGSIAMIGKQVDHGGTLRLYRVPHPIRIAEAVGGITPDGWLSGTPAAAFFDKFASVGDRPGTISIILTRASVACGSSIPTAPIRVLVSRIRIDANAQPARGAQLAAANVSLHQCENKVLSYHVRPPFRVDVTAVHGAFQPNSGDPRYLVAQLGFSFVPDAR